MRNLVPTFLSRWTSCFTLVGALAFGHLARADIEEAREYLAKAQEHLAANDTLVVDNLLRLAEAGLDDAPLEQRGPLKAEIDELRKQYESDSSARRARLVAQRLDRLFDEAEMTLGTLQGGGGATLRRIEQLLAEPDTSRSLGVSHTEKYRRKLTLFRRAHERKLQERGVTGDPDAGITAEADEVVTGDSAGQTSPPAKNSGKTPGKEPAKKNLSNGAAPLKSPAERSSAESDARSTASDEVESPGTAQPVQFILFGGTLSNTSLFTRLWKLLLISVAGFVGLVKSGFTPGERWTRLRKLKDLTIGVPMPMWGLLMAIIGLWWMADGWIVYGLLVSTAMLSLAFYMGIDVIERVGLVGEPAAKWVRKYGRVIVALAVCAALTHLFVGGAWMVV